MKIRPGTLALGLLAAAQGAYVALSASTLPEQVALHFDASGAADAYVSRQAYVLFWLGLSLLILLLGVWLPYRLALWKPSVLNIPNRHHWMAPARRAQTLDEVRRLLLAQAGAMLLLFALLHGLILQAHASEPPSLPTASVVGVTLAFLLVTGAFVTLWLLRFRTPA